MLRTSCLIAWTALISVLVVCGTASEDEYHRTVNVQAQFLRWPTPSAIPYYIDSVYTADEQALITAAIQKITSDMKSCIGFTVVPPTSSTFKIKITPLQEDGKTPELLCYSYPGYYRDLQNSGKTEQRLVLARGSTGCFDGNLRSLMKYLAVLLGKRNEHQRADRDQFITIDNNALQPNNYSKSAYRLYSTAEAYWSAFPYDYCSITHNRVTDFANPGQKAFTVKNAPFFIPAYARLSNSDCNLISLLYPGCDRKKCEPLDCAGVTTPATVTPTTTAPTSSSTSTSTSTSTTTTTTTTPTTSTTSTSTTTEESTTTEAPPPMRTVCTTDDFSDFCTKAPTASLLYKTGTEPKDDVYVLLSGNCALKYQVQEDSSGTQAQRIVPVQDGSPNPVDIRDIYTGYDDMGIDAAVTFAYIASANGPVYLSNSNDPAEAAACSFPVDSSKACDGSSWPEDPIFGAVSTLAPTPAATTVLPNDQFYVYVPEDGIDPAQLCLSNSGRPTTPLPDTQCLDLKNELGNIVSVTAIQYINANPPATPGLLVFGKDSAGVPLIAFGDAANPATFRPVPLAPTEFNTFGGAFPVKTYTDAIMQCP